MNTALTTRKTAFEMRHIANWCEAMAIPAVRDRMIEQAKRDLERPGAKKALKELRELQRRQETMLNTLIEAKSKDDIASKGKVKRAGWTDEMIEYWNVTVAKEQWQKITDEVTPTFETLESGVKFRDKRAR